MQEKANKVGGRFLGYYLKLSLLLLLICPPCYSHQLYESYIFIDLKDSSSPTLRWEVESNNLESIFQLDRNKNEIISWKEIKLFQDPIITYVKQHFQLSIDNQEINLNFESFDLERKDDQTFLIFTQLLEPQPSIQSISIKYDLFFDIDNKQICYVHIQQKNAPILETLKLDKSHIQVLLETFSITTSMFNFFIEGIWHIWLGIDHLLFLLMLLLPSLNHYLLTKTSTQVGKDIIKIVTSFSAAHTITLILSVLGVVSLPIKLIEVSIAISVFITAFANVRHKQMDFLWQAAFIFGLIHGFGFANALQEMKLDSEYLVFLLLSFNVGVEIGQLVLVLITLPILMAIKKHSSVYPLTMKIISSLTALISLSWIIERV
ncbi:MAG: HupE/UreJ family protein [Methylococcales bacterium]|nr:HupE/UreJ family protein [Methylococcales bacterium]